VSNRRTPRARRARVAWLSKRAASTFPPPVSPPPDASGSGRLLLLMTAASRATDGGGVAGAFDRVAGAARWDARDELKSERGSGPSECGARQAIAGAGTSIVDRRATRVRCVIRMPIRPAPQPPVGARAHAYGRL